MSLAGPMWPPNSTPNAQSPKAQSLPASFRETQKRRRRCRLDSGVGEQKKKRPAVRRINMGSRGVSQISYLASLRGEGHHHQGEGEVVGRMRVYDRRNRVSNIYLEPN